ncbi:MAG: hypothetical protein JWM74_4159 [Myxococcaceae bacterium]|nr:hypothetical protein [Myxococcaceae bacterium]
MISVIGDEGDATFLDPLHMCTPALARPHCQEIASPASPLGNSARFAIQPITDRITSREFGCATRHPITESL